MRPGPEIAPRPGRAVAETRASGPSVAGPQQERLLAARVALNPGRGVVQRLQAPSRAMAGRPNTTGLPDALKAGVEALSGLSLDGVRVHRNSPRPAQLAAHAYAQGRDIHLAPGQERHLPHEAWHVVQQAQGRVRPTLQLARGVSVNADPALEHEADAMGAKAARGPAPRSRSAALPAAAAGGGAVQMVHPAFNNANFWRPGFQNEAGEVEPHPFSPEGKQKSLTAEFGAAVMHEILYTELDEEAAHKREVLTRDFYARGGTPEDALTLLKKHPDDNALLAVAYSSCTHGRLTALTAAFGSEVADQIIYAGLNAQNEQQREALTRRFYSAGGMPGEALALMKAHPRDNRLLDIAYTARVFGKTGLEKPGLPGEDDPEVKRLVSGLEGTSATDLLQMHDHRVALLQQRPQDADKIKPWIVATNVLLRKAVRPGVGEDILIGFAGAIGGYQIWVYGRKHLKANSKAQAWIGTVVNALFNAKFLADQRPPLKIKVILHDRMSRDLASTSHSGNFITINIEEYQITDFSPGQMIGLLSHEVGVHSLQAGVMSPEELNAERRDRLERVSGDVAGGRITVGREREGTRQQDDHLTLARGLLGQISAAPRLHMYERTMVSLIDAQRDETGREETAAAYCVDLARILLMNDDPENKPNGLMEAVSFANRLANVAVEQWTRIQLKYGRQHPAIAKTAISKTFVLLCLVRLKGIVEKVQNKPSFL